MAGTARHLFARGNTARGVHCLYDSAFQGLSKLYLLSGYPGTGKSALLQRIAEGALDNGQTVELYHSPLYPNELDALILKDLSVGIGDAQLCEGLEAIQGAEVIRIDFGQATQLTPEAKQETDSLHSKIDDAYTRAYDTFAAALAIHDEWEAIYISHMDFPKADQVCQDLITELFGAQRLAKEATVRHLFFGAATPVGAVNHIPNLTAHLSRRIFIKGRPGSGKSTMLKRLAAAAQEHGFDVEVYHCGFDPNSLDMLILPELDVTIFDSTAPHEFFPSQGSDEILDMYARAIDLGTDERYASELQPIQQRYAQKMKEATGYLKEAQELHAKLTALQLSCTDLTLVNQLSGQLQQEIERLSPTVRAQGHDTE